jgi:hypothetical protein
MSVDEIAKQLDIVWNAPAVILPAGIALVAATWIAVNWLRSQEVRGAKEQVEAYKARLGGATPDEARAKIQKLEETIKRSVGSPWKPLAYPEVQALARGLAAIEKRRVQVMYENFQGKELARTIADAFEAAGWDTHYSTGSGFEEGLKVGRSPTVGVQIKELFERATTLKPIFEPPTKDWPADNSHVGIYVAVGTNPD